VSNQEISHAIAQSLFEVLASAPALCCREVQLTLHDHDPVVCVRCRGRDAFVQVTFERDATRTTGSVRYAVTLIEHGANQLPKPAPVLHFDGARFAVLHDFVTSTLAA
jgi:hypothetical protein